MGDPAQFGQIRRIFSCNDAPPGYTINPDRARTLFTVLERILPGDWMWRENGRRINMASGVSEIWFEDWIERCSEVVSGENPAGDTREEDPT